MYKSDLVQTIAEEADLSLVAAKSVMDALTATITKSVAKGEDVTLIEFGSFNSAKTGAVLKIAAIFPADSLLIGVYCAHNLYYVKHKAARHHPSGKNSFFLDIGKYQ